MTLADTPPRSQGDTLSLEFHLPHAPEKVWRALTDPELLAEWLLPVVGFQVEPGTAFTFRTQPRAGWDGTVRCQLREADAPTRLSYSWAVGDMLDTIVTFLLTPTPSGTRLQLVHSGFTPAQRQNFAGARYGWRMMGGRLGDLLARVA